jgi:ArsR family transcriptional regulator
MQVQRRLFQLQAELCAALADPTRLEILCLLGERELTVGDLMAALGLRQNNVSQHLAYLRRVGAVAGERRGTYVYYRVAMPGLLEACAAVREVLLRQLATRADEAATLAAAASAQPPPYGSPGTPERLEANGVTGPLRHQS